MSDVMCVPLSKMVSNTVLHAEKVYIRMVDSVPMIALLRLSLIWAELAPNVLHNAKNALIFMTTLV